MQVAPCMTITYDPRNAQYLDEADVRNELSRVADVCVECRQCVTLCSAFPTLFDMIEQRAGGDGARDAGRLTPAQQNQVVEECHQCKLCILGCPYRPGTSEVAIDFPRLMLRAKAMLHETGQESVRRRSTTQLIARSDLSGTIGSATAPMANRIVGAAPGTLVRKVVQAATGVSSVRLLPTFSRQRFSTWFKRRPTVRIGKRQGSVALFPTCLVEYQQPSIGHDLVKVYERNGIEVSVAEVGCCGAPWLHGGDQDQFTKVAARNVALLASEIRRGHDIVVPQPTCGYIIKNDYPDFVPGTDSAMVSEHTFDAAEYLMKLHRSDGTSLDMDFSGDVPESVTYHAPCHLRAQEIGLRSRDLMKLTGTTIRLVQQCAGVDGSWGMRAEHADESIAIGRRLADVVAATDGEVIAGDCHLANVVITEQMGTVAIHPIQMIARAYGFAEEHVSG